MQTSNTILNEEVFSQRVRLLTDRDDYLAEIVQKYGQPPLWVREPGFPTLVYIILEQQVSLASAKAAFDRLQASVRPLTPKGFLKLSDAELTAILQDPRVEIHVLYADGVPAGFAELDRRVEGEIEIKQFGLMPEFLGQGLGKYFLQWTLERAWSYKPTRVWLHTCNLDHPAALPMYLTAGFEIYQEGLHHEDKEEGEARSG